MPAVIVDVPFPHPSVRASLLVVLAEASIWWPLSLPRRPFFLSRRLAQSRSHARAASPPPSRAPPRPSPLLACAVIATAVPRSSSHLRRAGRSSHPDKSGAGRRFPLLPFHLHAPTASLSFTLSTPLGCPIWFEGGRSRWSRPPHRWIWLPSLRALAPGMVLVLPRLVRTPFTPILCTIRWRREGGEKQLCRISSSLVSETQLVPGIVPGAPCSSGLKEITDLIW
ncbi:hypothetical protein DAI22_10g083400 [Oryza sativa Japonica Group]|nr:hypothetical protein DAI22_10g083400 [Oryza sativa Japonica Group]